MEEDESLPLTRPQAAKRYSKPYVPVLRSARTANQMKDLGPAGVQDERQAYPPLGDMGSRPTCWAETDLGALSVDISIMAAPILPDRKFLR